MPNPIFERLMLDGEAILRDLHLGPGGSPLRKVERWWVRRWRAAGLVVFPRDFRRVCRRMGYRLR